MHNQCGLADSEAIHEHMCHFETGTGQIQMKLVWLNSRQEYGVTGILIHWVMGLLVILLLISGIYMVQLDYYDAWYNLAPWWHKALGMLTMALLLVRIAWRITTPQPEPLAELVWEKKLARLVHLLFYITILTVCLTGYLVSTSKGAPIEFFAGINIPALSFIPAGQVELSGWLHRIVAYVIIGLLVLHVLATLKHHFIKKDATLMRILIPGKTKENI